VQLGPAKRHAVPGQAPEHRNHQAFPGEDPTIAKQGLVEHLLADVVEKDATDPTKLAGRLDDSVPALELFAVLHDARGQATAPSELGDRLQLPTAAVHRHHGARPQELEHRLKLRAVRVTRGVKRRLRCRQDAGAPPHAVVEQVRQSPLVARDHARRVEDQIVASQPQTGKVVDRQPGERRARLALGKEPFRVEGRTVWSPLLDALSEVEADIAVTPYEPVTLYLEYQLYRPIFEADSIFNLFDLSAQNDLGARVEARVAPGLSAAAWGFARLADDSAGIRGDRSGAWVSGCGGGLGANHITATREISARFTWVSEWGENRFGGELGFRHGVFPGERLWLGYRVSAWHVDDMFSSRLTGNILGYVLSARFRIAEGAHLLGEFEQYVGKSDPHFVGLAMLQLDFWR